MHETNDVRRVMLMLKVLAAVAVLSMTMVAQAQAKPESPAVRYGCDHSHSYKTAAKGLRKALRHHQPLTRAQGRRAWHFILCVRKPRYADALRTRRLAWKKWRSSYANVWRIRFNGLSAYDQQWAVSTSSCEAHMNPSTNTGNGYEGAFQFLYSTWLAAGGTGHAYQHSWHYQAVIAVRWRNVAGAGQWPVCGH